PADAQARRPRTSPPRRSSDLTANSTGKPERPPQPFNRASRHSSALSVQLPPDFTRAVDLEVLLPDPADLLSKDLLSRGPSGSKRRVTLLCFVRVVGGWSDRQHAADRLDSILLPVRVDEGHHHPGSCAAGL